MRKKIFLTIILALMLTCCTKDGETIYLPTLGEEQPAATPLVTVIYGPDGTYRDLYLYCALHTLGSHVGIYNNVNFGNLYTTGPKDFFVKTNQ